MAGKQKTFTMKARDDVASIIASLPEKPKADKGLAAKDIITSLKAEIRTAQEKGYTIEEIVQSFKQGGVDIGLTTLKAAMRQSTKKRPEKAAKKVEYEGGNSAAPQARRTVTPEERQVLRDETETTLTPAASKRGMR
ncbi:hypothetical protein [Ferrovum myxofaciens]|uniref:hypothetical protein n=1 Tax=Ferrovum myxofaciens TaxID=416213 RepID=UPI000689C58C|nr:hypothetical protein [Ferrovum myxofaciens]